MKQIGLILPDDLSSNNEVLKSINKSDPLLLYEPKNTLKTAYTLHKIQLDIEVQKLETMLKATEKQKKVVETLKQANNVIKEAL